jgi:hypothetical protein
VSLRLVQQFHRDTQTLTHFSLLFSSDSSFFSSYSSAAYHMHVLLTKTWRTWFFSTIWKQTATDHNERTNKQNKREKACQHQTLILSLRTSFSLSTFPFCSHAYSQRGSISFCSR